MLVDTDKDTCPAQADVDASTLVNDGSDSERSATDSVGNSDLHYECAYMLKCD